MNFCPFEPVEGRNIHSYSNHYTDIINNTVETSIDYWCMAELESGSGFSGRVGFGFEVD